MTMSAITVYLPSIAGPVPIPGPLLGAALLLRHRMVKGVALDRALRFIARTRTARGCSHFVTDDAVAAEIDAVLPGDWRWARGGWDVMVLRAAG